jgi:ribose transport system permease protein
MSETAIDRTVAKAEPGGALSALRLGGWGAAVPVAAAWLLLIVISGLHRSDFISHQTILAVTFTMAIVGVLAVGQALIGISGGILDLSQPAALILTAYVITRLFDLGLPTPLVVLLGVCVGMLWGLLNATVIVVGKLNPIIVTLATNFIGAAVMFLIFQNAQAPLKSGFSDFGRQYFLGLPNIWWPMLALVLVVGFFLPRTRYGRHVLAVGGNRYAAQTRGISLKSVRFGVFIASGACVGLAGVLFACSNGPFNPGSGSSFQLPVIASVILGGVSLAGGRGNIWVLLLSVGFLSTVPTALAFFGFSSTWQSTFQGAILILAVAIDGYRAKRRVG